MKTIDIDKIIKEVRDIRKPWNDTLEVTGGAMADGAVLACDEILEKLEEIKKEL